MKKLSLQNKHHYEKLVRDEAKRCMREAHRKKNKRFHRKRSKIKSSTFTRKRAQILKKIFLNTYPTQNKRVVKIPKEFGLEESKNRESFYDTAEQIIDIDSKELIIDLRGCDRIWPSGVTLLCSVARWNELAKHYTGQSLRTVRATFPKNKLVNEFLYDSGFYEYVRPKDSRFKAKKKKDQLKGIRILRELKDTDIEEREKELRELLKKYSTLSNDEIEMFDCIVITEIFNNISDHGFTYKWKGWWIIANYHPKHEIISINFADNGVGIRQTLAMGPQKREILKKAKSKPENDHIFIDLAFQENISGAVNAVPKEKIGISRKYHRGARRGNGMNRIQETCKALGLEFTVLSHNGYFHSTPPVYLCDSGSRKSRIYAGTLYNIIIPAKGE